MNKKIMKNPQSKSSIQKKIIRKPQLESSIQREILKWIKTTYPEICVFSVPNEGRRSLRFAARMKANGMLPGVADLILLIPNSKVLFLEVKRPQGQLSENQKKFQKKVTDLGFIYHVTKSLENAQKIITKFYPKS